ncbi:MAG: hypothetical protein WAN36_03955 [Calditrichia bacterium]
MKLSEIKILTEQIEKNMKSLVQILTQLNKNLNPHGQPRENELCRHLQFMTDSEEEIIEFHLKKIVSEEHPYLVPVRSGKETNSPGKINEPFSKLANNYLKLRQSLLQLLRSASPTDWDRTGLHSEKGHISFEDVVRDINKRDKENIGFLNSELKALQ